ncbi:HET-domain-containing protein, partial [Pseudovirgaria hyperparasitica]
METCREEHTRCKKLLTNPHAPFIPRRLLKIDVPLGANIRIVESDKEFQSTVTGLLYATLSHAWGNHKIHKFDTLTKDNQKLFEASGIEWSRLPKTFQEAILVAKHLGLSWLWIDSLCIIQQGDGGTDWTFQAPLMHQVYRSALCNIAAADSCNATMGLFRDRQRSSFLPAHFRTPARTKVYTNRNWSVFRKDWWESELLRLYLYSRAWVFQERMLAARIVHYGRNQVFWDCAELTASEVFPQGLPYALDGRAASDRHWRMRLHERKLFEAHQTWGRGDDSIENFWQLAVGNYTRCNLTKWKDKLKALEGVAVLVEEATGDKYHGGLWLIHLVEQLAWRVATPSQRPAPDPKENDIHRFPTWSWASIRGMI